MSRSEPSKSRNLNMLQSLDIRPVIGHALFLFMDCNQDVSVKKGGGQWKKKRDFLPPNKTKMFFLFLIDFVGARMTWQKRIGQEHFTRIADAWRDVSAHDWTNHFTRITDYDATCQAMIAGITSRGLERQLSSFTEIKAQKSMPHHQRLRFLQLPDAISRDPEGGSSPNFGDNFLSLSSFHPCLLIYKQGMGRPCFFIF